jgi:hypothetical protein
VARKNLSRTVIEGGRSHRNIADRRQSHRTERVHTRAWLGQVRLDPECAEETAPRLRERVRKEFSDKLGAAFRWLERQVGRPWAKVEGELLAKFDTRTVAGRHILFGHMLPSVGAGDPEAHRWARVGFIVDANAILRTSRWHQPTWSRLERETSAWSAGRQAAALHRGWWWFRMGPAGAACTDRRCLLLLRCHVRFEGSSYHSTQPVPDRAMTRGDLRRLKALPAELRERVLIAAPPYR